MAFPAQVYPLLMKLNKNAAIILRARDPQAQEQVFDITSSSLACGAAGAGPQRCASRSPAAQCRAVHEVRAAVGQPGF